MVCEKKRARSRRTETGQLLDATSNRNGNYNGNSRREEKKKREDEDEVVEEENNAHHDGSASGTSEPNASYFTIGGVGRRLMYRILI